MKIKNGLGSFLLRSQVWFAAWETQKRSRQCNSYQNCINRSGSEEARWINSRLVKKMTLNLQGIHRLFTTKQGNC